MWYTETAYIDFLILLFIIIITIEQFLNTRLFSKSFFGLVLIQNLQKLLIRHIPQRKILLNERKKNKTFIWPKIQYRQRIGLGVDCRCLFAFYSSADSIRCSICFTCNASIKTTYT